MNRPQYHRCLKSLAVAAIAGCLITPAFGQQVPPPGAPQALPDGGPDQGPPGPGARQGGSMRGGMPGMPGRPMRPENLPPAVDLSGSIESFNYSPRGDIDGVMLKTSDKSVQVNLPPGLGMLLNQVSAGSALKVTARPEPSEADHPIYELVSLTTESGKKISAPGEAADKFVHEEASIKQLNYARHGEVDGALLDNGDFMHVGPAGRDLKLSIGQKITIDGFAHPMLSNDHQAIHAVAIDGKAVKSGPPEGPRPGMGPRGRRGGPGAEQVPPPPPGGRADEGQPGLDGPRPEAPPQPQ